MGPGPPSAGGGELSRAQFTRLVEGLEPPMLRAIRAILPGLAVTADLSLDPNKMLVFDDGKQQMWRLVPGGRSLVRKQVSKKS